MKKIKSQFRQGDVLIERVDISMPSGKNAKENDRIVLAHGEVTGHAHELEDVKGADIVSPSARVSVPGDGDNAKMTQLIMSVGVKTSVKHQEHAPISVKRGIYRVTRQREYSPEAIRNVAD